MNDFRRPMNSIPVLPESAPFTAEQRAYLNGFFAGLFSHTASPSGASQPQEKPLIPLTILFGSQTGNAEQLAKRAAKEASRRGFAPSVHALGMFSVANLANQRRLLIVASTFGDGEPPDNAKAFWSALISSSARLTETEFSVCSLGDQNYPSFCAFGRALDAHLESMWGRRAHARVDCDVEYEQPFLAWLDAALAALGAEPAGRAFPSAEGPALPELDRGSMYSRDRPYPSRVLKNRRLANEGSTKDVRHLELSLGESDLSYEVGDAVGVWPANHSSVVQELLSALEWHGDELVPGRDGVLLPVRLALQSHYEITRIPRPLLEHFAHQTGDSVLTELIAPDLNAELQKFLWGREIIDLLLAYPAIKPAPANFVSLLRKLQPRLYSIASSPKAHPGEVHLCVSAVRYQSLGRTRRGVASTFLADAATEGVPVPVFVHSNPGFRLPPADVPLIMIGPGTGIAPFRAFLEERRALGAQGRNWLFFGDQHASTDFLYQEEITGFKSGVLTRLDLAWSRDQQEKVYVQHRMRENAMEFFDWLEAGATVAVCGDAARMARDVDAALHEIVQSAGGRTREQADECVRKLVAENRYLRDVY